MFAVIAKKMLENAGYKVTLTDMPGLVNVEGLANNVTLGQLCDLAEKHGNPWFPPPRNFSIQTLS